MECSVKTTTAELHSLSFAALLIALAVELLVVLYPNHLLIPPGFWADNQATSHFKQAMAADRLVLTATFLSADNHYAREKELLISRNLWPESRYAQHQVENHQSEHFERQSMSTSDRRTAEPAGAPHD
jgi:hypothetical protein